MIYLIHSARTILQEICYYYHNKKYVQRTWDALISRSKCDGQFGPDVCTYACSEIGIKHAWQGHKNTASIYGTSKTNIHNEVIPQVFKKLAIKTHGVSIIGITKHGPLYIKIVFYLTDNKF